MIMNEVETWLSDLNLERTTPQSRRKIIGDNVKKLIRMGINQTQSLITFRNAGLGINSADFGAIYRENRAIVESVDFLKGISSQEPIDTDDWKITEADYGRNFVFVVGVSSIDEETGIQFYQTITLPVDTFTGLDEIEQIALDYILTDDYPLKGATFDSLSVLRGYHNAIERY